MHEYLEKLKAKPKAVRERIAIGTSLGVSGIVALGWLMVMVLVSPFATPPADDSEEFAKSLSETRSSFTEILAGAGAASATTTSKSGVEIVNAPKKESSPPTPAAIAF